MAHRIGAGAAIVRRCDGEIAVKNGQGRACEVAALALRQAQGQEWSAKL